MTTTPSTRTEVILAHIFCIFQQVCSIVVLVLGKRILATVDVTTFVFMRIMFVVPLVSLTAFLLTRTTQAFKLDKRQFITVAASGVLGIFMAQSLMYAGLKKSTPTAASVISAPCVPIFTALFSILRGTDKMTAMKALGFASSIGGALILLKVWDFEFKGTTLGNLLIVGSSLCNAANSLVQKQVLNTGVHPLVVQSYVCLIGAILYTIGYAPFGLFASTQWILPGQTWLYIVIVGIVATAIPWCAGIIALKHTSPMTFGVYTVLQPPLAVFVGIVLMGEELTLLQAFGSVLVLLGLVFVNASPVIEKLLERAKRRLTLRRPTFGLLPTEEEEKEGMELEAISEDVPDGAGPTVETDEVNYNLSQSTETNDFVLEEPCPKSGGAADYNLAVPWAGDGPTSGGVVLLGQPAGGLAADYSLAVRDDHREGICV